MIEVWKQSQRHKRENNKSRAKQSNHKRKIRTEEGKSKQEHETGAVETTKSAATK